MNPQLNHNDIMSGGETVSFVVVMEIFGDYYEVETYRLSKERWDAMSPDAQRQYVEGQEEQIRDTMNMWTETL